MLQQQRNQYHRIWTSIRLTLLSQACNHLPYSIKTTTGPKQFYILQELRSSSSSHQAQARWLTKLELMTQEVTLAHGLTKLSKGVGNPQLLEMKYLNLHYQILTENTCCWATAANTSAKESLKLGVISKAEMAFYLHCYLSRTSTDSIQTS